MADQRSLTICYGINNSHEPNFFASFIGHLRAQGHRQHVAAQDYIEVVELVRRMGVDYRVVGRHYGGSKLRKAFGLVANSVAFASKVPRFDVAITHGNPPAVLASAIRRRTSIAFSDNDINFTAHKLTFPFLSYLVTPRSIPIELLVKHGASAERIRQYDGFKEDIYVAEYEPDPAFVQRLPFEDFVVVRAEATKALYVPGGTASIAPRLLKGLARHGLNVLFLPRYDSDRAYAAGLPNVHIPDAPVNGLDACYYARAVLTGAGTFAREAACLGTPAVSFFPGPSLLLVDQDMVRRGWMMHSRDPDAILDHVLHAERRHPDLSRSKGVQREALRIVDDILAAV